MALTLVRAWRGLIRARLKDTQADLNALLAYNTKHPTYNFLTSGQVAEIDLVLLAIQGLLSEERLR